LKPAPILLFCYKRVDTLKKCIASLQKCPEAIHSDLLIISDGSASTKDEKKVWEVREFLKGIRGFKSIHIINRDQNLGVKDNIILGIKEMAASHHTFIVVEDDLEVAPDFLRFLNEALIRYENNPSVLSISAFSYVKCIPSKYQYDAYFAKRFNPWGWATWSKKINLVDWEVSTKDEFLQSKKIQTQFNRWGSDRSYMLKRLLSNKMQTWDIQLDYYLFRENLTSLYPAKTLVKNIGFGTEDATHTKGYNRFEQKLEKNTMFCLKFPELNIYNSSITRQFKLKNSLRSRLFTRFMKMVHFTN